MNMIEFLDARLLEEEQQILVQPDHKWMRACEMMRLQIGVLVAAIEQRGESLHRHPVLAGLMPMAMIWDEHPEYEGPQAWLPDNGLGDRRG